MKISSSGIIDGTILDQFGKRGNQFGPENIPTYSLPFKIENAPKNTVSFAVYLEDKDDIPSCGHAWIHWTIANLMRPELKENESIHATDFIQGTNSWSGAIVGIDRLKVSYYGGMAPEDSEHLYELFVFALDTTLPLKAGFYYNELYHAMQGHILESAKIIGKYKN